MTRQRSARLAALLVLAAFAFPALSADDDGVSLFNGSDLNGWKGNADFWRVEDGTITGTTTADKPLKYNTFLIWTGGTPGDFELRLKYKINGGNSGIQYRSKVINEDKFIVGGYQADIDAGNMFTGINYEERGRGILVQRGERVTIREDGDKVTTKFADRGELAEKIKKADWNDYRVVAKGNNLKHYINGELMSEVTDEQKDKAAATGILALQLHQGPPMKVQFKDLRLKELK